MYKTVYPPSCLLLLRYIYRAITWYLTLSHCLGSDITKEEETKNKDRRIEGNMEETVDYNVRRRPNEHMRKADARYTNTTSSIFTWYEI